MSKQGCEGITDQTGSARFIRKDCLVLVLIIAINYLEMPANDWTSSASLIPPLGLQCTSDIETNAAQIVSGKNHCPLDHLRIWLPCRKHSTEPL